MTHPACDDGNYPFKPLFDDKCFNTVDRRVVYMILFLSCYFLQDLMIALIIVKGKSSADQLMNVHHVVSFSSCIICLYAGYGTVYVGLLTSLMEYSSLPVNYRALMTPEELFGPVGMVNNILFLVLYTIFRVCLLPFTTWKLWMTINQVWTYISASRQFWLAFVSIEFLILTVLSYYWFFTILKMLAKFIGLIKKDKKGENLIPWRKIGEKK